MTIQRSKVGVYPHAYPYGTFWNFRVIAPNALMPGDYLEVHQGMFPSEETARAAALKTAQFYDDMERYRVRGVKKTRLKRPVKRGRRTCLDCGKPHDCYEYRQGRHRSRSWASLEDGHSYNGEPWEDLAKRLAAEKAQG